MKLLPLLNHEINSSKSIADVKELLNVYAKRKTSVLEMFNPNELEVSAAGENNFIVYSNKAKWLTIEGEIESNNDQALIRLTFQQHIITVVFQIVIFIIGLVPLFLDSDYKFLLFLTIAYFLNLLRFHWQANKMKSRLIRLLE